MAERIRRHTIDEAEIARRVDLARYFLRIILDPPLMPGDERDAALAELDAMLASADAAGLRQLALAESDCQGGRMALDYLEAAVCA